MVIVMVIIVIVMVIVIVIVMVIVMAIVMSNVMVMLWSLPKKNKQLKNDEDNDSISQDA